MYIESSLIKDDNQKTLKAMQIQEESFIEDTGTGVKEKEPAKCIHHDGEVDEIKSITEEDTTTVVAEKLEDAATNTDSLLHN